MDEHGTGRRPVVGLIAQGLGNRPAAQQWRNLVAVDLSFYKSPLSEEIRDEGRAQGLAQGRAQGLAEGVLLLLEVRGITVPDETREKITDCRDPGLLHRWLNLAATATTAEEILATNRPPAR